MAELGAQEDGREEFKKSLYRNVFYGPIRNQKTSREGRVMERLYPTIYALLLDLKQGQYQRPARLMQKLEAHFIYDRICCRIEAERPRIFLGTIHDALVTTPDQADYVSRVMMEEFAKVGVTPTICAK